MGRTPRLFVLCILIAAVSFSISCSGDTTLSATEKKKTVALVLKMNTGYYWGTIKLGADTAAREFNVDIDFNAPSDEGDVKEQINMVNRIIDEGKANALILAASDFKALAGVTGKAYDKGLPVIIIDSEVNTSKTNSFIATNNMDAGKKAGEKLVSIAGPKCRVAVMSFVKGTRNAEKREEGLMSVISRYRGIKVAVKEYSLSDSRRAYRLTKEILKKDSGINAIVALNAASSEGVAQAIDEMGLEGRVKVIAFDNTTQEIDFLEDGVIQALIVQKPFAMGYLGVKYAVEAAEGKEIEAYTDTGSIVIDRDNMYLPENQKLLFPFIK